MSRLLIALVLCCMFSLTHAQGDIYQKTLPNGFKVFVFENHEQPLVYGAVAVRAGSKNDPSDATGIAHYLEHMLFKGTEQMGTTNYAKEKIWLDSITHYYDVLGKTTDEKARLKIQLKINELSVKAGEYALPNEIDKMLAEIGSTGVNAYTTVESTVYYNSFPSNQVEKWMEIYSHRFQKPVFRLFQSELETVYEEKNRNMDDKYMAVFELYLEHFFKHHPYGQQTTLGKTEHLKNPSLAKMYQFFETYYVPNNMALIITGDVSHEEVFALAEKKFGVMQYKEVPELKFEEEKPFNGKEILRVNRTPISAGVIGYRLPKNTDPDMPVLGVISSLLTNSASSGSIDRITNERKLMMAGLEYMPYNDGGTAFLYFVPKPVIQTLHSAEKMVLKCVDDIKNGNFTDDELNAVKTNRIKQFKMAFESNAGAAGNIIDAYIRGISPEEHIKRVESVQDITREQIQTVAKKYFGDNCLALYSRLGSSNKKDKLAKPPFKPVVPKSDTISQYYAAWKKIPSKKTNPRFVDFTRDVDSISLAKSTYVLKNKNPFNNIVTMNLIFGTGKHYIPILEYTDSYLLYCGTKITDINAFNKKLYALGCSFVTDVTSSQFVIKLSFPEENLDAVLALMHEALTQPAENKDVIKKIKDEVRANKYMNMRSSEYWSDALTAYVIYGEKSGYLDKMSFKEMKRKGVKELVKSIGQVWKSSLRIIYTGNIPTGELTNELSKNGFVVDRSDPQPVYFPQKIIYDKPLVYVVHSPKARQTQVEMIKVGDRYDKSVLPEINGFNKYFGGDMSSIMFQEIREFRSLAYSTSGSYYSPGQTNNNGVFIASAGTQNDKTMDCVETMYGLVNNMPVHTDRMDAIRKSLLEMGAASRPSFRGMISYIESWKRKGFKEDPAIVYLQEYSDMKFDDIVGFYNQTVKNKPTVVCVTGNLHAFKYEKLKKYGTIKRIDRKKLVK